MAIIVPKINEYGAFTGRGRDAVARVQHGFTFNVCSPEFGADPTGVKDCTAAIQAAVNKAAAAGGGTVVIPAGKYRVAPPFIEIKGYITIMGEGIGSTILFADNSQVTDSTEETGVFHTGTYNRRVTDKGLFRTSIMNLSIYSTQKNGAIVRSSSGAYQHIAADQCTDKVWGIVYNTFLDTGPADPDSVHTIENVEIWDTTGGIALLGLDDQGCKVSNVRIRRTWKQGLLVGKPPNHPEAWETNPGDASRPYQRGGAADNKFLRMDVSSANIARSGYAGIEVYTSQCMFAQCTSWYHKRYTSGAYSDTLPTGATKNIWNFAADTEPAVVGQANEKTGTFRYLKDGAGWFIAGRDNEFSNCTSQETGGHGWIVAGNCATLNHCRGESPSFYDSIGDAALTGEAAGFVLTNWAWGTHLNGCIVKNAYRRDQAAKVGFYIQPWAKQITLRDCSAFNMPYTNGTDNTAGEKLIEIPPASSLSPEIYASVNDFFFSNFPRDTAPAATGTGSNTATPTAAQVTPAEIGSLLAHWDFSDTTKLTTGSGRISAATLTAGTAPDGTLKQDTPERQPLLSALAGKPAIKFTGTANEHLLAANIGSAPITGGWSTATVVAVNTKAEGQYIYSAIGAGYKDPSSLTVNSKLELRPNSGGGSAGYTAKTSLGAIQQYVPAVVVVVAQQSGLEVYVNGVRSTETPPATGTLQGLSGRIAYGSYYGGTGGVGATIGEAALFSKALTPDEVSGLSGYLAAKWSS